MQNRKRVVSKNISGPSRGHALLTKHHWKHKIWTTKRGNVTFQAVVKVSATERRTMVQAEVRCTEENQRKAGTTKLKKTQRD